MAFKRIMRISFVLVLLPCWIGFTSFSLQRPEKETERIEDWTGKTVMIISPHPDDDTFACGGTMAKLAKNGNKVIVVIYTNDNKGSHDLEMTSERLTGIRKAEEEAACAVLGIPKENIIWLGYPDGELEYVPSKMLCGQVAQLLRIHRPDAVFSVDPGKDYEQWHKTDHRMAAFNTVDAMRASSWHLYFPNDYYSEGLLPYSVPVCYMYYSKEPNCWIDIEDTVDLKVNAIQKHVSQMGDVVRKYRPTLTPEENARIKKGVKAMHARIGKEHGLNYAEAFRKCRYGG